MSGEFSWHHGALEKIIRLNLRGQATAIREGYDKTNHKSASWAPDSFIVKRLDAILLPGARVTEEEEDLLRRSGRMRKSRRSRRSTRSRGGRTEGCETLPTREHTPQRRFAYGQVFVPASVHRRSDSGTVWTSPDFRRTFPPSPDPWLSTLSALTGSPSPNTLAFPFGPR